MLTPEKRFVALSTSLAVAGFFATITVACAEEQPSSPAAVAAAPAAPAMQGHIDPETGQFSPAPSSGAPTAPSPRAALGEELPIAENVVAPGAIDIDVSGLVSNFMNARMAADGKVHADCQSAPAVVDQVEGN